MEELTLQRKVTAEPMTRLEYNEFRGWALPNDENGADLGYKLTTLDGTHVSWSPKEVVDTETATPVAVRVFKSTMDLPDTPNWNGTGFSEMLLEALHNNYLWLETPDTSIYQILSANKVQSSKLPVLTYIDRLNTERTELATKVNKLREYIKSVTDDEPVGIDIHLKQLSIMEEYLTILGSR